MVPNMDWAYVHYVAHCCYESCLPYSRNLFQEACAHSSEILFQLTRTTYIAELARNISYPNVTNSTTDSEDSKYFEVHILRGRCWGWRSEFKLNKVIRKVITLPRLVDRRQKWSCSWSNYMQRGMPKKTTKAKLVCRKDSTSTLHAANY